MLAIIGVPWAGFRSKKVQASPKLTLCLAALLTRQSYLRPIQARMAPPDTRLCASADNAQCGKKAFFQIWALFQIAPCGAAADCVSRIMAA